MSVRYRKTLQSLLQRKASASGPLKLDQTRQMAKVFDNPFNNYKCIHVAGTNGKGSVCSKLSAVLKACGYSTGLTLSPHISCVRERIQINHQMISENEFCDGIEEILKYETEDTALSFFELITILSFNYFAKQHIDYAVIEVGLGGRLDASNIITNPLLSVITSISLDHTAILGETTDEITKEKAGIIKAFTPVVIGESVNQQIINDFVVDKRFVHNVNNDDKDISFEEENIFIAKKCVDVLAQNDTGFRVALNNIDIDCVLSIKPDCRFEIIKNGLVDCIMDCAHNLCGIQKLFHLLTSKYDASKYDYRVVIGMSKGKNVASCLRVVADYAKYIHFVSISHINKRSLSIDQLKECYQENQGNCNIVSSSLHTDCHGIMKYALNECNRNNANKQNKEEILIVCGSLYIMSEARQVLGYHDVVDPFDFSDLEFGLRNI